MEMRKLRHRRRSSAATVKSMTLRLQLEAVLEAARATRPSAKTKSPVLLPTGDPTNPKPEPKRRSLAAAPLIAQPVLVGFQMSYWAVARLEPRREQLALRYLGLAGYETYLEAAWRYRGATIAGLIRANQVLPLQASRRW